MSKIKPQPGIMDIALYQGGKSHVDGVENVLKLSSNENPFGPVPAVKEEGHVHTVGQARPRSARRAQCHCAWGPASDRAGVPGREGDGGVARG